METIEDKAMVDTMDVVFEIVSAGFGRQHALECANSHEEYI